jgi:hypothetical protein
MTTEQFSQTEEMRHVPPVSWLIDKLDHDVRSRIETLYTSCFESGRSLDSPTISELETRFRQIYRWLERMGEQARGRRGPTNHDFNLRSRVRAALAFAIESLATVDPVQFRRRNPPNLFERSRGECLYAAFLMVTCEIDRLITAAAAIDPDLHMKLIEPPYSLPPPPVQEQLATV